MAGGGVLTGDEIVAQWTMGRIIIDPLDPERVGPNSVDLTLAGELLTYDYSRTGHLDAKSPCPTVRHEIPPDEGFLLLPGVLYLGSTVERCGSDFYVPWLDGRSSMGRLGLSVHVTAGRGDLAFLARWTLEITVVHPLTIYAGMKIGQLTFFTVVGNKTRNYKGKYQNSEGPIASRSWMDFAPKQTPQEG